MTTQHSIRTLPARSVRIRDWQRWAPYAAVVWSLAYAALGIYWAVSGNGFPYAPESGSNLSGPMVGRFGSGAAWMVVVMAGIPAAVMGTAMMLGVRGRVLRPLFITVGIVLGVILLLFMADLTLLEMLGYVPYSIFGLITGGKMGQIYLDALIQLKWTIALQLFCLAGGFLWLAATISYARLSSDACLYCGRRNESQGWNSPQNARRWGRIAVYVSMAVPVIYAITRYAWALGIPLGITEEHLHAGQEGGIWISGLFLATFGLVGALLTLGLIQRWGEVFPRWMIGLAGKRVPIALAVVPATLASVILIVGGTSIWSGLGQMMANAEAAGITGSELTGQIIFEAGPALLFPIWGVSLAVATLGYYFRRRGACSVCGRGASNEDEKPKMNEVQGSE